MRRPAHPVGEERRRRHPRQREDIDGDGGYDNTTSMSEFTVPATLNSTNWAGNQLGTSSVSYSTISSINISELDAAFYTNHTMAALVQNTGAPSSSTARSFPGTRRSSTVPTSSR